MTEIFRNKMNNNGIMKKNLKRKNAQHIVTKKAAFFVCAQHLTAFIISHHANQRSLAIASPVNANPLVEIVS